MAGTEQPLMNLLSKCVDYLQLIKLNVLSTKPHQRYQLINQPSTFFGGGSFNHKFLRIVLDLCLAYIYNDKPYISTCEQRLILFLKEQEEKGHCCIARNAIETLSGSHGQLNIAAASVAYLFWCYYGQLGSLGTLLTHWHWSEISLFQHCKLPDTYLSNNGYSPTFHCPGWRAIKDGELTTSNPARDLYGRIILGYSYPDSDRPLYKDKYNLGARAILLLKPSEQEKLLPPKDWKAPVPYDFKVWKTDNNIFLIIIDAPINRDLCTLTGYHPNIGPFIELNWKDNRAFEQEQEVEPTYYFPATQWSKNNRIQP